MKQFADQVNYKLAVDPATLCDILLAGSKEHKIGPIQITHDEAISPYTPYQYSKFFSD